jgi:hypothetical protein
MRGEVSETSSLLTHLIGTIRRLAAAAEAQAEGVRAAAEVEALRLRSENADAYAQHRTAAAAGARVARGALAQRSGSHLHRLRQTHPVDAVDES